MRYPLTWLWLPVLLGLLPACETRRPTPPPPARPAAEPPAPRSYAPALLRTGLVAPQHRRWLQYCDTTTRDDYFQLGHTPEAVRGWLARYEEKREKHWHFDPDTLGAQRAEAARNPPPLEPKFEIFDVPDTPAEIRANREQTVRLVHQLRQAGLLTATEHRQLLPLARAGEFYSRRHLLTSLYDVLGPARQLREGADLLAQWPRLGLLSAAQLPALSRALRRGDFADPVELLAQLPHARVFERRSYPAALQPYLRQLHQDVARLLPELPLSDFRAEVVPGEQTPCVGCVGRQDVVVHLRLGGRAYCQRSELTADFGQPGGPLARVNEEEFYQVFNQALADRGAPYRLAYVEAAARRRTLGTRPRFGLWSLAARPARTLVTLEHSLLRPRSSEAFELLPSDSVTAALRAFEALGFFRRLTPGQRQRATERAQQTRFTRREEPLRFFPGSVGEYRGSPAYASWSYERLLQVLSATSAGQFRPTQVRDGARRADGPVSFRLGGRAYRVAVAQANEYPDARLFRLVQRALREQGVPGKFYQVGPYLSAAEGMAVCYVFLRPEQAQLVRGRHLLRLTDPELTLAQQYELDELAQAE